MSTRPRATVSAEDIPTGAYRLRLRGHVSNVDPYDTEFEYEISIATAECLVQQLTNSLRQLHRRQTVDAICGDCTVCRNTRMVHPLRNGRPWAEHCPVCHPKVLEAEEKGLLL